MPEKRHTSNLQSTETERGNAMETVQIKSRMSAFLSDQSGAVAIEYALLAAMIALAIIAGTTALGMELDAYFTAVAAKLGEIFDVF